MDKGITLQISKDSIAEVFKGLTSLSQNFQSKCTESVIVEKLPLGKNTVEQTAPKDSGFDWSKIAVPFFENICKAYSPVNNPEENILQSLEEKDCEISSETEDFLLPDVWLEQNTRGKIPIVQPSEQQTFPKYSQNDALKHTLEHIGHIFGAFSKRYSAKPEEKLPEKEEIASEKLPQKEEIASEKLPEKEETVSP